MTILLFVMSFFIKISKNFYSTVKKEGVIKMIKLIILIHPHFSMFRLAKFNYMNKIAY